MATAELEQRIDTWLEGHGHQRTCPACESDRRRIDFNPPRVGKWQATERYKKADAPIDRIEITCLGCASVRVFDAGVMGIT